MIRKVSHTDAARKKFLLREVKSPSGNAIGANAELVQKHEHRFSNCWNWVEFVNGDHLLKEFVEIQDELPVETDGVFISICMMRSLLPWMRSRSSLQTAREGT